MIENIQGIAGYLQNFKGEDRSIKHLPTHKTMVSIHLFNRKYRVEHFLMNEHLSWPLRYQWILCTKFPEIQLCFGWNSVLLQEVL